jgi:hypothetical protein
MEAPMKINDESTFITLLETDSLTDIALIKSVLDAEGVSYFIQGENMRFMQPGVSARLMVQEEDIGKALDLLRPLKLSYVPMVFGGRSKG